MTNTLPNNRPVLIAGGAGFIGSNLAERLLQAGRSVLIFDNLSRRGVERNLERLTLRHGTAVEVVLGDIRDSGALNAAVRRACAVYHFAAQVAVTTSLDDPEADFDVNARGTLNVLQAVRAAPEPPPLLFTSTNKVYGALEDIELQAGPKRYEPLANAPGLGVDESRCLDFHSPYGCSKGAADQYVRDFARSYGLETVVFRMSCIYGPHQFGTEDQGWVAHFLLRALARDPIVIYGDGKQVRDVLFVEDLVDALLLALENIAILSGQAFNIGGGPRNTASLLEVLDLIAELTGERPRTVFENPRVGDQRYYVSNVRQFSRLSGWSPKTTVRDGVHKLLVWARELRSQKTVSPSLGASL